MKSGKLILKASDINIVFGGLHAVSDFNMELHEGQLAGLIGPNGAGKTTVFNMLSGVYTPTSGTINFFDKKGAAHLVNKKKPYSLNKIGIARTFQNIRLFGNLTVADNIRVAMHSRRKSGVIAAVLRLPSYFKDEARMNARVGHLLRLFGLTSKRNELAKNLPYGEQRKLEICRALASKPRLLLLDEPAAGMNPQETKELMELIALIRNKFKITILLIEHDMKLVMGICEEIYVLNYGKILAVGKPEEIRKNPEVVKAYLGSDAEVL